MSTRIEQTTPDVDDWIDGVSYTQAKVTIHRNPALLADLVPLNGQIVAAEQRLAELQAAARPQGSAGDATLGDTTAGSDDDARVADATLGDDVTVPQAVRDAQAELDALLERAEALYDRYDADTEVWTLRALDRDETATIVTQVREDFELGDLPKRRSKETAKAFTARQVAWQEKLREVEAEVALRGLARAVVSVTVAGDVKPPPQLESLRRLKTRPHGERHYAELVTALQKITTEEVEVPAPHRRGA